MTNGPATPTPAADTPAPTLTVLHVILVSAALIIMSGFSAWVVDHYQPDSATNAATILGIVVPAFATVGAAAFGITVAYKSGKKQGTATGQQQGQATAAGKLEPHLADAEEALAILKDQIQQRSFSPPGSRDMLFGVKDVDVSELADGPLALSRELTQLDSAPLESATASLARARGALESLRGGA